ncbi:MAG TPA: hypothetical protein VJJ28_02980, partial [Candidatus Paceibacterota bacterium]
AKIINYAQDYIGQLCRSEKLDCRMVGRSWFVTEESLLAHRQSAVDSVSEKRVSSVKNVAEKKVLNVEKILKNISNDNNHNDNDIEKKSELLDLTADVSTLFLPSPTVSNKNPDQKSSFKYESEKGHFLPALEKRAPSNFALPKSISNLSLHPSFYFDANKASFFNTTLVVLVIFAIVTSGLIFAISFSPAGYGDRVSSQASVISVAKGILDKILGGFNSMSNRLSYYFSPGRNISENIYSNSPDNNFSTGTTTSLANLNGIGVIPSSQSTYDDEQSKLKIRNYFSDEVSIHPDRSGTAGVITPVFKKNNGNDFVYVLVPVKEKTDENTDEKTSQNTNDEKNKNSI